MNGEDLYADTMSAFGQLADEGKRLVRRYAMALRDMEAASGLASAHDANNEYNDASERMADVYADTDDYRR